MAELTPPHRSLLRNHGGGHAPVSNLELFFDLVYVFAITQVSHTLLMHLSWTGFAEATVLFGAVWWAWMYTTWAANWAEPERVPVRIMLLVAMLASMVMAVAMPRAFATAPDDRGLLFVCSYLALQVGRSVFMALAMWRDERVAAMTMVRIAAWFSLSTPCWIGGALTQEESHRLALWAVALVAEYAGPIRGYRLPLLGRSQPSDWTISGSHMAERCALFIIIALGEGVVVTGANFAAAPPMGPRITAFLLAFVGSALMWWIYFDVGAERGAKHIENHAEPGRVARNAYTYLHMPIVAGVVVSAVADALILEEPRGPVTEGLVLTQCGGLLVYLLGTAVFKRFGNRLGNTPLSHLAGIALLLGLGGWSLWRGPSAIGFFGCSVVVLAVVAMWEWGSYHGGWEERIGRLFRRRAG
ncbi:low temperature requirement protein A [Novosphingobium cyanobacteriorum]|uniref:Low temperature requirement protein A n=1 Tax=Novosphingobium cyanobacteriorum TaxID=3024215 RepID=A0ABT6CK66_9SPHN|nr:low temperature requirement protein A [Novosphingobium cyanobacteriorum]MDF8334212.1 low temperature requirement protein A [Novosphingobium cyanobacteriorum]